MNKTSKVAIVIMLVVLVVAVFVPVYYLYLAPKPSNNSQIDIGDVVENINGSISVMGNVAKPENLTIQQLYALGVIDLKVDITTTCCPGSGTYTYTGISLRSLLQEVQANSNATGIVFSASDGCSGNVTMSDVYGSNQMILAYLKDDSAMAPLSNDGEGPIRLVIGNQTSPQYWLKGIITVDVV